MRKEQGSLVVFEGGEGTGKTTQARLLAEYLESQGYSVVLTREPGDGSQQIRDLIMNPEVNKDPRIALCLFLADRRLHILNVINPALEEGKIMICDRYEGSTFAYQALAEGLDFQMVKEFNDFVTGGLQPEVTILFDLSEEVGLARKRNLGIEVTHYDQKDLDFHQKLREGFLKLAQILPNWVVIDAEKSPEKIHQKVIDILKSRGIV